MSELPKGWIYASIAQVAKVQGGIQKQPKRRPVKNRYPFLRVANVLRGGLDLSDVHEVELFDGEPARYLLRYGDLLVVEGNGSPDQIGRAAMWRDEIKNCTHQNHLIRVRPSEAILPSYLALAWNSPYVSDALQRTASSTSGLYTLSTAKIKSVKIPLPPLNEQRRIVTALEDHLSRIDAGIKGLATASLRLKRWNSALLTTAISGRLSGGRRQWTEATIGELAEVGTGATPLRSRRDFYEGGTIPWVTSTLLNQPYVEKAEQFITEAAVAKTSVRLWPPGTLLVAMYGEGKTRGRCSELRLSATTNQACAAIVLRKGHEVRRPWVKLFLEATYELNRSMASGGVQPNLNLGIIRSIKIPLPPLDAQEAILADVDRRLTIGEALRSQVAAAKRRAERLRLSLLSMAFSGSLVDQYTGDEPAPLLLMRIQRHRAALSETRGRSHVGGSTQQQGLWE
jgi:type I restriction enzyme S subunit